MDLTGSLPLRATNGYTSGQPGGLDAFDGVEPAPAYAPLPPGVYSARVVLGEFCQTKAGADAYRLRFEVTEGPQAGKTLVRTWTFSPKPIPYTKRDLAVFGLSTSAKLLSPFPEPGRDYVARLVVALQRGDDGIERNDIKRVDLVRVVESPAVAFLLPPRSSEGGCSDTPLSHGRRLGVGGADRPARPL